VEVGWVVAEMVAVVLVVGVEVEREEVERVAGA
jgi:hypothetical protein